MVLSRWVTQCRSSTSEDTLKSMVLSGSVDPIEHWRLARLVGGCCHWCVSSICAARVSAQARTSMPCIARCDLRFGLRSFSEASGIQCGTRFSNIWSVAPRQVGDRVGHTLRGMQTAELERPPHVAHHLDLATLDRAADRGGN